MTTIEMETALERSKRLERERVYRYRLAHPERIKQRQKFHFKKELARNQKRRKDPATWANMQLSPIRHRARKMGLDFNLVPGDIVVPEFCPVLGVRLEAGSDAPQGGRPSIDRFDNSKGYVLSNIRVISYRANMLKRDATLDEMRRLVSYMEGKL